MKKCFSLFFLAIMILTPTRSSLGIAGSGSQFLSKAINPSKTLRPLVATARTGIMPCIAASSRHAHIAAHPHTPPAICPPITPTCHAWGLELRAYAFVGKELWDGQSKERQEALETLRKEQEKAHAEERERSRDHGTFVLYYPPGTNVHSYGAGDNLSQIFGYVRTKSGWPYHIYAHDEWPGKYPWKISVVRTSPEGLAMFLSRNPPGHHSPWGEFKPLVWDSAESNSRKRNTLTIK